MKTNRRIKGWILFSAALLTAIFAWVAIDRAPELHALWRLEHGSVEERIQAVHSLEEHASQRAPRIFTEVAREDEAPEVRVEASWALLRLIGNDLDDDAYETVAENARLLARKVPYLPRPANSLM